MADQLATPQDLASLLQLDYDSLTTAQQDTMTMLVELATAKVQRAAGGQRIVDATSTALLDVDMWCYDRYLYLPQRPVRSVASVSVDGAATTDYVLRNQALWRLGGWNLNSSQPTQVTVAYTHGYASGSQWLQLGRDMTLSLARVGYGNPGGVNMEAIDDYRVSYAEADARMQITDAMRDTIADAYGISAYVTSSMEG